MKRDAAEILKEALALPTEARAALAGSLLDSLDTDVDEDAEAAWATEVNRRVAELDSGAVKTIPWQRSAADSPRADAPVRGRISSACC
ncbi:MAG: addiction module protein, partial [Vicinamibacterales bacterium]